MTVSTLHIVPYVQNKQVIQIKLKTDLRSPEFALLVTESDRPGTVILEVGNSFVRPAEILKVLNNKSWRS